MSIALSIRKPASYSEINGSSANNALPSTMQELVFIGQRTATGTVLANVPTKIFNVSDAAKFFGAGSILHRMVLAAFKQNPYVMLTACAVDDAAAGVLATSTITLTGTASASGTISVTIGTDVVTIAVASAATAANTATALSAEINKYPNLPVVASVASAVVTLTAKNKGTCGNYIGKYDTTATKHVPAVTITSTGITAAIVGFSSGATDPVMTSAYAALAGKRYHLYAIPFQSLTSAQELMAQLDSVSDEINQKGARGYMFQSGALAGATTTSAVNAKRISIGYIRGCKRSAFENAAAYAAMQAAQEIPWLAINNTELVGCDAPDIADRLTFTEQNALLSSGVTPFEVGAGEKVRCVRSISTYTLNRASSPDITWLDSFKIAVADYVRDAIVNSHKSNFANCVIRDNHVDGEPDYVITPADVNSNNIAVCKRIEKAGGLNNVDGFKNQFSAVRNANVPGRIDSEIPIDIVDAAHIFANTIKIVSSL
jgi:phage tail sheath gpL-like